MHQTIITDTTVTKNSHTTDFTATDFRPVTCIFAGYF